jgi:hypothetical protein
MTAPQTQCQVIRSSGANAFRCCGGLGFATLAFNDVSGIGRGGTGVLKVDGKEAARQSMTHTVPLTWAWDENFDIRADTGTPVAEDYEVPFRFTGKLDKLTLKIDRPKLTPEDEKRLREAQQRNNAGRAWCATASQFVLGPQRALEPRLPSLAGAEYCRGSLLQPLGDLLSDAPHTVFVLSQRHAHWHRFTPPLYTTAAGATC